MSTKQSTRYATRREDMRVAIAAGDVAGALVAAGDVLRRSVALAIDRAEIEASLAGLERAKLTEYVRSIDAEKARARLERGLEEAFEALLADEPSERTMWQKEALHALRERDALESARVAVERLLGAIDELDAKIAAIDAGLAKKARCLVGLNGARAEELAELDVDAREGAWWYAARSQSDGLAEVLAGRRSPNPALATSAEDRRDLERLASIEAPPKRVDGESLWLREIGAASEERARWAERHLDGKDKKALGTDVD